MNKKPARTIFACVLGLAVTCVFRVPCEASSQNPQSATWTAQWIGIATTPAVNLEGANWIWCDEPGVDVTSNAPAGTRFFRREITLNGPADVVRAVAVFSADKHFKLNINGKLLGGGDDWQHPVFLDATAALDPGLNQILVQVDNDPAGGEVNAAGLIGKIHIERTDGSQQDILTDGAWESSPLPNGDAWKPVRVLTARVIELTRFSEPSSGFTWNVAKPGEVACTPTTYSIINASGPPDQP